MSTGILSGWAVSGLRLHPFTEVENETDCTLLLRDPGAQRFRGTRRRWRSRKAVCAAAVRGVSIVERTHRHEVAKAPPFESIRRKFGADPAMLAFNLMGPHANMHVALTRRDAANVAEYIRARQ